MSTDRIYIDGTRVTVSKPGYSASSPPAVDYAYLSLDSRLNQGRPLEVGLFTGAVFGGTKMFYSTTYPHPPAIDVFGWSGSGGVYSVGKSIVTNDASGSTVYQRTSWVPILYTDGFLITDDVQFRHARIWGTTLNLYYIAWQVW
ncbi:hypothetical protein [Bradyrhizobium australafricanum]|uniref:hypothetical protein n=1 Tax=Bradyrhizobium australafricanum TaxID=2821406 RepID=UPI001CE3003F|nr:hypothetical protein [Bradyrhizobium australafricanum]MCA6098874.1 hypothetical protein [Bradyrhizobium australafricanum]